MNELSLGRYQIAEQIGAGGMGVVYRARDQRLDRDVAVKVLPTGSLADQVSRSRFRKEALALSRLTHPNIAVVHDFDSQDDTDFLVMELVPGMTLEEKLLAGPIARERKPSRYSSNCWKAWQRRTRRASFTVTSSPLICASLQMGI